MIKAKYMPVVTVPAIKKELEAKGVRPQYRNRIREMMFDDMFTNDVYVSYRIADDVCEKYYTDKEEAKVVQMIIDILREVYPDSERVLVDVSW